jgi:hypothetical protein
MEDVVDYLKNQSSYNIVTNHNGFFSVVVYGADAPDFVLKLNSGADYWHYFARNIIKQKAWTKNTLFPHIQDLGQFKPRVTGQQFYYAFIEFLEVNTEQSKQFGSSLYDASSLDLSALFNEIYFQRVRNKPAFHQVDFDQVDRVLKKYRISMDYLIEYFHILESIIPSSKRRGGPNSELSLDFKSENIGFRSNGDLVFFDVIY